jgi:hypothetical protein
MSAWEKFLKNSFMSLTKMTKFRKSPTCPLSNDLLAFQTGKILLREKERITVHLRFCEFCTAEVEFYAHYPLEADETVENAEIPKPLFELAEALLSNKHRDNVLLKRLFNQADDSKFTDF